MNKTFLIKQTKFNNGEIAPYMYGETAHPKYASSLRSCLNWLPIPQGALVKRSGTEFIGPVKDETYAPRLIKFSSSDNQSFLLEFGNLYLRIYKLGRYVGTDGALHDYPDAQAYYELVTIFTKDMLPYLKFDQVGNTLTICYGGQVAGVNSVSPQDLKHSTNLLIPWTISNTPRTIPAGAVTWLTGPTDAVIRFLYSSATDGVVYNRGDRATQLDSGSGAELEWICIQDGVKGSNKKPPDPATLNSTNTALAGNLYWMPAVDISYMILKNSWVQTVVVQDSNGVVYESTPSPVLTINSSLSLDRQRPIIPGTLTLAAGYTLLFSKYYRASAGGAYGWVQDITNSDLISYPHPTVIFPTATTLVFLDDGRTPDFTKQPPKSLDPFLVNGTDYYPTLVGYLDQRRLWADLLVLPASIFLSKAGDLYNFDSRNSPGADSDAMTALLASDELEQIRAFTSLRRGLLFTSQGEWTLSGAGGGSISRSSVDPKRQSTWGSSWLNPIKIGTGVLFNTAKSNMVRDFYPLYGLYSDLWDGQDLSVMARHLLDLYTLTDWTFQSVPYPVVWAVRSDGVLISLTYQHAPPSFGQQLAEGIVAWARHATYAGDAFEATCSVPEPPQDAIYLVAKRVVNGATRRYIERLTSLICPASPYLSGTADVRYGQYLDSCVTYDGHNDQIGYTGINAVIDSIASPGSTDPANYTTGSQIKVTVAGGPFTAADAADPYGSGFVLDPENLLGLASARGRIVGYTSSTQVTVELDTAMTQAQVNLWTAGAARWALSKGQISATHLLGYPADSGEFDGARGVLCLSDGDAKVLDAWDLGVAYLAIPAVVIQIGLAYNADVLSLDAFSPNAEIRNKFKETVRVGFEVAGTRDLWMGPNFVDMVQWTQRQVVDAYNVMGLQDGYFEEELKGEWDKSGRVALRHFNPLPAVLSSVLREMKLGDS